MPENSESIARGRVLSWLALVLLIVLVLYFLSAGPVSLLFDKTNGFHGMISLEQMETFYQPIIWLHDHTFMKKPVEWYLSLWGI